MRELARRDRGVNHDGPIGGSGRRPSSPRPLRVKFAGDKTGPRRVEVILHQAEVFSKAVRLHRLVPMKEIIPGAPQSDSPEASSPRRGPWVVPCLNAVWKVAHRLQGLAHRVPHGREPASG